jgi:hypothetical protein
MPVSSVERVVDVGIPDLGENTTKILYAGLPGADASIRADSKEEKEYAETKSVLRWYFGLMGETSPVLSPLSVDVAGDKQYQVYRYDWVFGVTIPNILVEDRKKDPDRKRQGTLWWDWQKALSNGTCVAVQVILSRQDSGVGYTCVATNLNALPPSRDTRNWWQRNRKGVIDVVKTGAQTAEQIHPGMITKTISALSNSLDPSKKWFKWKQTNWFIYQFLDSETSSCAVEWRIGKKVLKQYGPLLRGSLVLAFHGTPAGSAQNGIRMTLRPQLGFIRRDDLNRINPTENLDPADQVQLTIMPVAAG